MKNLRILLFLSLLPLAAPIFAQVPGGAGWVVTHSNDTIFGKIHASSSGKFRRFTFNPGSSRKTVSLRPRQVRGFQQSDDIVFYTVSKNPKRAARRDDENDARQWFQAQVHRVGMKVGFTSHFIDAKQPSPFDDPSLTRRVSSAGNPVLSVTAGISYTTKIAGTNTWIQAEAALDKLLNANLTETWYKYSSINQGKDGKEYGDTLGWATQTYDYNIMTLNLPVTCMTRIPLGNRSILFQAGMGNRICLSNHITRSAEVHLNHKPVNLTASSITLPVYMPGISLGTGYSTTAGTCHTVTLGLSGGYYFLNKKKFDAGTVADISLYIGTTF